MRKFISFFGTRIGISLLVFIVIISLAFYIKNKKPSAEEMQKSQADIVVEQLADQLLKRDNENGQYKTWDELYGTSTSATSTNTVAPKYSSTDLFSQEIFKEYLARKQNGEEITADVSNSIAQDVLSKSYATNEDVSLVSEKDIKTESSAFINMVSYGNLLVKTVTTPLPKGYTKSEIEILQDIVNDPTLLGTIDFQPFVDRYASIKKTLLAMKVPDSAVKAHMNIINGISHLMFSAEGMTTLTTDPIGGIGKTSAYNIGTTLLEAGFAQIKQIFDQKNVTFSPNEPAYPFFI